MERKFNPGDIVRHFKRETMTDEDLKKEPTKYLYLIIGTSRETETKELYMVYKPLYSPDCVKGVDTVSRPLDMFMSEVDHEKYPDIKQKYRFEKVDE